MGSAAFAQSVEEEVLLDDLIVVAQKREERLKDVPLAVAVIPGARIESLGIRSFEQLSRITPGLTVSEAATGNRITVRGISSGTNRGFEQSVGLFVDGVYAARARQFSAPFFDVERVKVLKGPQGVLFGKNTVAGAVSLITAQPTREREIRASAAYETRFGAQEATAIVNGPLTDELSARLSLRWADADDGPLRNSLSGRNERASEEAVARLSLAWSRDPSLQLAAKYEYSELEVTGSNFQVVAAGPFAALFRRFDPAFEADLDLRQSIGGRQPSSSAVRTHNALFRVDRAVGTGRLVALTGYAAFKSKVRNADSDFTPAPIITFDDEETFSQISQELRLESAQDRPLSYVTGLYYQRNDYRTRPENIIDGVTLGAPRTRNLRDFDQSSTSYSAFAEATWRIREPLRLTLGARYAVEDKDVRRRLSVLTFDGSRRETDPAILAFNRAALAQRDYDVEQSRTERQLSPSATLQYDLSRQVMAYARATRGFKGGGFDASDANGGSAAYEDERVTAYEAGLKSSFGTAELNLAIYSATFRDLQVQAFDGISFLTANAGKARSRGVDLDGRWKIAPHWLVSGSLAYLSAEYLEYRGASCTTAQSAAHQASGRPGGCVQDLSGRPLTDAPQWSASANLNHHRPLAAGWTLDANLGVNYRSAAYVAPDLDPLGRQGGYATWDGSVQVLAPGARWSVSLAARNLTDTRAKTYLVNAPLFNGTKSAAIIEPRKVEVRLRAAF